MATVGIIANPAAGKDIRRLVAHGRLVPNQEKVNTLKRVLLGLDAVGIERVAVMPDAAMLGKAAADSGPFGFDVHFLDMPVFNDDTDSARASQMMVDLNVDCVVTLGGDGTNRVVASALGQTPLVPISTGTNNVFPAMVEGTVAGMAAGVVARGLVDMERATTLTKRLEVRLDGKATEIALIDAAVSRERFVAARAIWDIDSIEEIFLTQAEPGSIGLSAIGGQLHPTSINDDTGMYVRIGPSGTTVRAPVAPGMVVPVEIAEWRELRVGERLEIEPHPCTIALDGERTFSLLPNQNASVTLDDKGPRVVDVDAALREAAMAGVFVEELAHAPTDGT